MISIHLPRPTLTSLQVYKFWTAYQSLLLCVRCWNMICAQIDFCAFLFCGVGETLKDRTPIKFEVKSTLPNLIIKFKVIYSNQPFCESTFLQPNDSKLLLTGIVSKSGHTLRTYDARQTFSRKLHRQYELRTSATLARYELETLQNILEDNNKMLYRRVSGRDLCVSAINTRRHYKNVSCVSKPLGLARKQ